VLGVLLEVVFVVLMLVLGCVVGKCGCKCVLVGLVLVVLVGVGVDFKLVGVGVGGRGFLFWFWCIGLHVGVVTKFLWGPREIFYIYEVIASAH
jgi:hypothetical protein